VIYSAGDLGIEINLGANEPGSVLQRQESGGWLDYLIDGSQVRGPVDVKTLVNALPAVVYRLTPEVRPAGNHS